MLRYSLESLWRNRGRYLLFGILFALLGGAWLISLLLGEAAGAIREEMIALYGRSMVIEKINEYGAAPDMDFYAQFNDPEIVESMTMTKYIQADVLVDMIIPKRMTPTVDPMTGEILQGTKTLIHTVGMDYTGEYSPFARRTDPWRMAAGRLPERDDECAIYDEYLDQLIEAGILEGIGDVLTINVYAIDQERLSRRWWGQYAYIQEPRAFAMKLTVVGTVERGSIDDPIYALGNIPAFFVTIPTAQRCPTMGMAEPGMPNWSARNGLFNSSLEVVYRLRTLEDTETFAARMVEYSDALIMEDLAQRYTGTFDDGSSELEWILNQPTSNEKRIPAYRARTYIEGFDELLTPLARLAALSAQMTRNLTLLVAVFFAVLTVLNLNARTYEIGVLRCVGMSRWAITFSLLLESLVFLLSSLLLGVGLGALTADSLMPKLIAPTYRVFLSDARAGMGAATLSMLAMGVGICLVVTVGAAMYIQRCRPLTILRNRN